MLPTAPRVEDVNPLNRPEQVQGHQAEQENEQDRPERQQQQPVNNALWGPNNFQLFAHVKIACIFLASVFPLHRNEL